MSEFPVIDPAQLARIESAHRGFLYQHLIGVMCLLSAADIGIQVFSSERDEDVEIVTENATYYLQVKHLSVALAPADVSGALARFEALRTLHRDGVRSGVPQFFFVSSSEVGPKLASQVASSVWPSDVAVVTPVSPSDSLHFSVFPDIQQQWTAAVNAASQVDWSRCSPETLVWKLAAIIQALSAGVFSDLGHSLKRSALPDLFEQISLAVDHLPPPPSPYRPHEIDPGLRSLARVRMIVGVSGSGKTAWASEAARHSASLVVYARATETTGRDFASWIAGHVAANLLAGRKDILVDALRPGSRGTETLRVVDAALREVGRSVVVVVDDFHHLDTGLVVDSVRATKHIEWLLLSRPFGALSNVVTELGAVLEELPGWSERTVAEVMLSRGVKATPIATSEVRRLTGGAPMLVENIAGLALRWSGGNLSGFVEHLLEGVHEETTTLEMVVQRDVTSQLSEEARLALGSLSCIRASLPWKVVVDVVQAATGCLPAPAAQAARMLVDWRVVRPTGSGWVMLHDSFRTVGSTLRGLVGPDKQKAVAAVLKSAYQEMRSKKPLTLDHVADYLRAVAELGDVETAADVATGLDEWWREYGLVRDVEAALQLAFDTGVGSIHDRFLLADSLTFLRLEERDRTGATQWYIKLREIYRSLPDPSEEDHGRVLIKRVLLAGLDNNLGEAVKVMQDAKGMSFDMGSGGGRALRYNFALVAFGAGRYRVVEEGMESMIGEYICGLGLEFKDVLFANPDDIEARLPPGDHTDDFRHIADCCLLLGQSTARLGEAVSFEYVWAMKFYDMANAPSSAIKAAIEVADMYLWNLSDPRASVAMFEGSLIPLVKRRGLTGWVPEVHSLYAIALACVGRHAAAIEEMSAVEPFESSMPPQDQAVTRRRRRMVMGLCDGSLRYVRGMIIDRQGRRMFTEPISPSSE